MTRTGKGFVSRGDKKSTKELKKKQNGLSSDGKVPCERSVKAIELINSGSYKEAQYLLLELIKENPNDYNALGNLGVLYGLTNRDSEAIDCFKKAIEANPNYALGYSNLGISLHKSGSIEEAIEAYNKALVLNWNNPDTHYNLGISLKELGFIEEAIDCYKKAIDLDNNYVSSYTNLSHCLVEKGLYSDAFELLKDALRLNPTSAILYNNLGIVLHRNNEHESGLESIEEAIRLSPDYVDAYFNLGNIYDSLGRPEEAINAFNKCIALDPFHKKAQLNRSMSLLAKGEYLLGFKAYEWRWATDESLALPPLNIEYRWDGNISHNHKSILIVGEQGFGDTLHFMRYVKHLKTIFETVLFIVQPQLVELVRYSDVAHQIHEPAEILNIKHDCWASLLSLPMLLNATQSSHPFMEPYIRASGSRIKRWKNLLADKKDMLIGINWQGNPSHETTNSRGRSTQLSEFAILAELPNISLISLQKGFGSEQLEKCSFISSFVKCQDEISQCLDFVDSAAIIMNCDLVITTDTCVAHLAAGQGKQTWLALKHVPEWRWGLTGTSTHWYPSLKLFRQKTPGDWKSVFQNMAFEIENSII